MQVWDIVVLIILQNCIMLSLPVLQMLVYWRAIRTMLLLPVRLITMAVLSELDDSIIIEYLSPQTSFIVRLTFIVFAG